VTTDTQVIERRSSVGIVVMRLIRVLRTDGAPCPSGGRTNITKRVERSTRIADGAGSLAEDEIAFPVTGHGSGLRFRPGVRRS
jgi:hypothetical protein